MRYTYAGQSFSLPVEFRDGANFVVPDANSVRATIYDSAGTALVNGAAVDHGGSSRISYGVTQVTLATGQVATRYELVIRYTFGSGVYPGEIREPYTVIKYAAHGASPQDVRALLGLTSVELSDALIDVQLAYLNSVWDVTDAVFTAALAEGGQRNESCRQLVIARAAQDLMPSLKLRVAQNLVDGTRQFERLREVELDELADELADMYAYHRGVVTGDSEGDLGNFILSTQADPFTG